MDTLGNLQGHGGLAAVALLTLVFAAAIALLALWITLPAAVLGVRSSLRELLAAQREANRELGEIRRNLEKLAPPTEVLTRGPNGEDAP